MPRTAPRRKKPLRRWTRLVNRPKRTPVTPALRLSTAKRYTLWARFEGLCPGCGQWMPLSEMEASHRKALSQGGDYSMPNLVGLHGWRCHRLGPGSPHADPDIAWARGLVCKSWQDPAKEPLLLWDGRWVALDDRGGYTEVAA